MPVRHNLSQLCHAPWSVPRPPCWLFRRPADLPGYRHTVSEELLVCAHPHDASGAWACTPARARAGVRWRHQSPFISTRVRYQAKCKRAMPNARPRTASCTCARDHLCVRVAQTQLLPPPPPPPPPPHHFLRPLEGSAYAFKTLHPTYR